MDLTSLSGCPIWLALFGFPIQLFFHFILCAFTLFPLNKGIVTYCNFYLFSNSLPSHVCTQHILPLTIRSFVPYGSGSFCLFLFVKLII